MTEGAAAKGRSPFVPLGFILLAFIFVFVNATMTAVELPAIRAEFGASFATAELTVTLYWAVGAGLLMVMGQVADRWGRSRMFLLGIVLNMVFSVLIALAPTLGIVLLGRVLQSIPFAIIAATAIALINSLFKDHPRRGTAFGLVGSAFGFGVGLGNLLGGVFAETLSWRWSFWLNVPVYGLALIGVWLTLPPDPKTKRSIDWKGAVPLAIGLATLVLGLAEGEDWGWITKQPDAPAPSWFGSVSPVIVCL